ERERARGVDEHPAFEGARGPRFGRDVGGDARPDGGASRRRGERQDGREALPQALDEDAAPLEVHAARAAHVAPELSVLEELGDGVLDHEIALAIDVAATRAHALDERARRDEVADAQAWGEDLRERSEVDDDARAVGARERQDGPAVVVELVIVVVLED